MPESVVYDDDDKLLFFARFGEEGWIAAGTYYLKSKTSRIYDPRVTSLNDMEIAFASGSGCVGYKIVSTNAFYYTRINAYPSCRIKHSGRIDGLIEQAYALGEKKVPLTNRSTTSVYRCDYQSLTDETEPIFTKNDCAINYIIGYEKESSLSKTSTFMSNNKVNKNMTVGWKLEMSESYMTQDGRVYVAQDSGIFYDLIPDGSEVDTSTVSVTANGEVLRSSQYDVTVIRNYHDSGRTLMIVKIKVSSAAGYTLSYSTIHSWESIFDYGSTALNSAAYETGNDSIANGCPDNGGSITDAALMAELDPATDAKKFIYTERSRNIEVLLAVNSGLYKRVSGSDDSEYKKSTIVRQSQEYTYRLRYATDFITKSKNMILYDNIENYSNTITGVESKWHGNLQQVDVSHLVKMGIAPVVYFSDRVVDLSQDSERVLSNTRIWKRLEDFGDITRARAFAVDMTKASDGSDFVLGANESVVVMLYMKSPEQDVYSAEGGNKGAEALNDISLQNRLLSIYSESYYQDRLINWNYDSVELRVMGDIPILKVDATDPAKPVSNIYFRLNGTSDYGTGVDTTLETDVYGKLTFKNIEKGTYTLVEDKGSQDYLQNINAKTVVVQGDGRVRIDGELIEFGTAYLIDDEPRVHADIKFNKRDLINKHKAVPGVKFVLTGMSDYNNAITKYAESGSNGVVTFEDIEMGSYELYESESVTGYVYSDRVYTVRVDENGNFAIEGAYMEKDGTLTIYNEPYHSLMILKMSGTEIGSVGVPLKGATFRLKTISGGSEYNETGTTMSNGKLTFFNLETGKYILNEVKAPEGYTRDERNYRVVIDENGSVTLEGLTINEDGEIVFRNNGDDTIVITKKWVDNETNATRSAQPVIRLGYEAPKESVAYFGHSNGMVSYHQHDTTKSVYDSVLLRVTRLSNIKSFEQYRGDDESYVKSLIENNIAQKIDDDSTDKSIYAWYISDSEADDYGAVYWWSDAAKVYLTNESRTIWKSLYNLHRLDVRGIDVSKMTDMSYIFTNLQNLSSLEGIQNWDTSHATDMNSMFSGCGSLTSLDLNNWDISNVTSIGSMFNGCTSLTSLLVSDWDTSSVVDMMCMFQGDSSLTTIGDISGWNTSKVTNVQSMFSSCSNLTELGQHRTIEKLSKI